MKLKWTLAAALLAVGTLANPAQAVPWTLSTQGTIAGGTNFAGVFGAAGQELGGLRYTQTITADTDPAMYHGWGEYGDPGHSFTTYWSDVYGSVCGGATPIVFTETVTINGKTLSFNFTQYLRGE